eukprot:12925268-Prorocentrum_lima.AAC.1
MLSTESRDDVSSPRSSFPGTILFGRCLVTCFFPVACYAALCFAFCSYVVQWAMLEHQEFPILALVL